MVTTSVRSEGEKLNFKISGLPHRGKGPASRVKIVERFGQISEPSARSREAMGH